MTGHLAKACLEGTAITSTVKPETGVVEDEMTGKGTNEWKDVMRKGVKSATLPLSPQQGVPEKRQPQEGQTSAKTAAANEAVTTTEATEATAAIAAMAAETAAVGAAGNEVMAPETTKAASITAV